MWYNDEIKCNLSHGKCRIMNYKLQQRRYVIWSGRLNSQFWACQLDNRTSPILSSKLPESRQMEPISSSLSTN